MDDETLEQMQTRHRREQRELQGRITSKKKNTTKKTRKGINDECAELERQLKERQEAEVQRLRGSVPDPEGPVQNGQEMQAGAEAAEAATAAGEDKGTEEKEEDHINGITDQLRDTGLGEPQPKKRNRQKERLARRAAEQEAAATAAQDEAANIVDYARIERKAMEKVFSAHALVEKEVQADGHCLFAAVADQLEQQAIPLGAAPGAQPFRAVRIAAAGYMEEHADDFAPFLEEPLASHIDKIRETAEWGGQLELTALASRYGVEIRVVQDGRTEVIRPAGQAADAETRTIWLAYYRRGFTLGEHYNSLRKRV